MIFKDLVFDVYDIVSKRDALTPPLKLRRIIGQQKYFFEDRTPILFQKLKLPLSGSVLDVGCGCGAIAVSLVKRKFKGQYVGIDIVKPFTTWLTSNISVKYPNYKFIHSDIYNSNYNRNGSFFAGRYKFPFSDESFDAVFLSSVFTHMLPEDMQNYLCEVARVLKSSGRCFISYFIAPQPEFVAFNGCSVRDVRTPEAAVAYALPFLLEKYAKFGLYLVESFGYGCQTGHVLVKV